MITASVLALSSASLHALPEVRSNKSLGTWQQFVTKLGLQKKPEASVYFDTDRLEAGEYLATGGGLFDKDRRVRRLANVGRVVKQKNGPDIVVYDFDEIYTVDRSGRAAFPRYSYLFGRRPAAIVADGQINNWPVDNRQALNLYVYNSCDPKNPWKGVAPHPGRGGDGERVVTLSTTFVSGGGGGGYGLPGTKGIDWLPARGRPRRADLVFVGRPPAGRARGQGL